MKAADVCRYADISYRQLDHWTRQGYLEAYGVSEPGSGNKREYSRAQADKARLMQCMISVGFEVSFAEKVASFAIVGEYKLHVGHGITLLIEPHEHKDKP